MNDTPTTLKRPRKRLRFTLGAMMLLIVVLAGALAWIAEGARRQKMAVARIRKLPGATVLYDWQRPPTPTRPRTRPKGPKWLREALGADVFDSVVEISFIQLKQDPNALLELGKLGAVDSLSLMEPGPVVPTQPFDWSMPAGSYEQLAPLKKLKHLTVFGIPDSERFLPFLADKTQLESLNLFTCTPTDSEFAHLSRLSSLVILQMNGRNITDAGFAHVSGMKKLQTLNLFGARITSLEPLRGLADLQTLMLGNMSGPKEPTALKSLAPLNQSLKITHISLGENSIDDGAVEGFGTLPRLKGFHVMRSHLTADGVRRLSKQPALADLSLEGQGIDEEAIMTLVDAPYLVSLTLDRVNVKDLRKIRPVIEKLNQFIIRDSAIEDESLVALANLPQLRVLNLSGCAVTDGGVARLEKLPALEELSLERVPMTDASLATIGGLTSLKKLDLNGSKITDVGLGQLAKLASLDYLSVASTSVSDLGIPSFQRLARLAQLFIKGTRITPYGRVQLANRIRYVGEL